MSMRNDGLMDASPDHTVLIAVLAVGGALIGALIAAVSADTRQRRQLKHDRALEDLAELRSVLDEASVALDEGLSQTQNVFAGLEKMPRDKEAQDVEKRVARLEKEGFRERMGKLAADRDRMIVLQQRMAIRIGSDQALCETYQDAISLVIESIREMYAEDRRQEAGEPSEFVPNKLNSELIAARNTFAAQAVALVGSRLPQD
jgi:hypothetical protein